MGKTLWALFGATILFAAITQAERKIQLGAFTKSTSAETPSCEGRPEFITEVRPQILGGFDKLPAVVLVANEADYYVESKTNGNTTRVHSYQSFKTAENGEKSKIVCGSSKALENNRFALFAPTLIDTTVLQKVGQSLWQFQVITDQQGFSVWNKRSLAFSESESLEKNLQKFGGNYQIYQTSPDQYEVVISKDENGVTQYLSVKYDAVHSI